MNKITDRIYNVGVCEYNSYLVLDDKVALIDTVPERLTCELVANIEAIVPISKIDYIICNHTEPDRSGAISYILKRNPNAVIVGTIAALKNLHKMLNTEFNELLAKDSSSLSLGKCELKFLITPNLNWPDTMMTYLEMEKALFTCDFLSSQESLVDYFNTKFSAFKPFVRLALEKLKALDFDKVLCGNGAIILNNIEEALKSYHKLSEESDNAVKKISIVYYSEYGYTRKLAEAAFSVIDNGKYSVGIYEASECSTDVIEASDGILIGTPTVNRNAAKPIWDLITSLDLVKVKNKSFGVFGSYGWSGEGPILMNNLLKSMRLNTTDEPFTVILNPDTDAIENMKAYTKEFLDNL